MSQKRLTFTVEGDTYRSIVDDLDDGQTVDDWVRAAIQEYLYADQEGDATDYDDYEDPLEFVDDCAI